MQVTGGHQAVAAVVAAAAEDGCLFAGKVRAQQLFHLGHHGQARVFHQHDAGDAEIVGGRLVGQAHLFSRK